MPIKRASPKAKSDNVFGQARRPAKMFRVGLYARVSTNDHDAAHAESRSAGVAPLGGGWTITVQNRAKSAPVR